MYSTSLFLRHYEKYFKWINLFGRNKNAKMPKVKGEENCYTSGHSTVIGQTF